MKISPDQSKCSNSLKSGLSKSISANVASVTAMPGPTLMKNSQCHENAVGQIAADRRADRRRERCHEPDQRRDQAHARARKDHERGGEDGRDHAAADEALHQPPHDHLVDRGRQPAHQARGGEAGGRDGKENPRPERARQKARERDHHHFGDEVGGLHPGNLVAAGGEAGLDLGERGGDDLDVEDRHEHAEDHGEEGDETARLDPIGAGRRSGNAGATRRFPLAVGLAATLAMGCLSSRRALACARSRRRAVRAAASVLPSLATAPGLVSTLTTTDMPGRSTPCSATAGGTAMRTGTRCTILVKLPVALSGGSSENTEPEAGATLTTRAFDLAVRIGVDRDRRPAGRA